MASCSRITDNELTQRLPKQSSKVITTTNYQQSNKVMHCSHIQLFSKQTIIIWWFGRTANVTKELLQQPQRYGERDLWLPCLTSGNQLREYHK